MGLQNGDLAHYHGGKLISYPFIHDHRAMVHQLLVNSDGSVLAATSYGLEGLRKGRSSSLKTSNGLPCDEINAITYDHQGNLWFFMECALGKIASTELQKWWENPEVKVPISTLDVFDGVRAGRAPFVAAASTPDGRLWFVNGQLLETIDLAQTAHNSTPPVRIEQIVADRISYPITGLIQLPPLIRDPEIDYTSLSYVAPQKVVFRYRLDGRDRTWQEPGNRRQAFYNDLRPGTYHFHVTAHNNDGIWNEAGATLDFSIAPAWYQTVWFRLLCLAVAIAMTWAIYRIRVRQIATAMSAGFDERLAERMRMARDLHDTFLQTLQGSKFVADLALKHVRNPIRTQNSLQQLSEWLARAMQEGRAALRSLRESGRETNDLATALGRALEDCRRERSIETSLSVTGDARAMHPIVRDELYRIGYEAIRNACTHSAGSRIDVALNYTSDLSLKVRDNGSGIDPAIAETGRNGHFGLQEIRERADRIGARLTLSSSANSGTEVKVVVPGRIVFRKPQQTALDKIKSILKRED